MLTLEQNERLTRVGPGTPGGALLRRYWHPLCPTKELASPMSRKRVRILGEDLVVYRTHDGDFACVAERCPHRNASLYFGYIEPGGMRCCYHGWKFDGRTGACVERPFEQSSHEKIRVASYPVEQLGGLLFVYMGPPGTATLLPRWDVLVRTDRPRKIVIQPKHRCNWLQIQENTADTLHTYYLHGRRSVELNGGGDPDPIYAYYYRPIKSYDWEFCEWGIERTLEYGGERPEVEIRPPMIFPTIVRIPEGPMESIHFRVPIDDEHTRIIWLSLFPAGSGPIMPEEQTPFLDDFDKIDARPEDADLTTFFNQDRVVFETQGVVADRSIEILGASDRGIVMFRRMLAEQIDRVERGEEPDVAVVRDPEKNRMIEFSNASKPHLEFDLKHDLAEAF